MEKKDQTDYAAAYRQFCQYGNGRSLNAFCEDENFNYSKFRRYVDKLSWTESKANRDSIRCKCAPVEIEKPEDVSRVIVQTSTKKEDEQIYSIDSICIRFTNGLNISVSAPSLESIVSLLQKLVG